jgi:hypothetical protein|tara:strand:+ start:213 stop:674 length:462 start_codon:yes stop_codon:yes gene_type:complete
MEERDETLHYFGLRRCFVHSFFTVVHHIKELHRIPVKWLRTATRLIPPSPWAWRARTIPPVSVTTRRVAKEKLPLRTSHSIVRSPVSLTVLVPTVEMVVAILDVLVKFEEDAHPRPCRGGAGERRPHINPIEREAISGTLGGKRGGDLMSVSR